ncbi:hypothetical protein QCA50_016386 [Cerrena zonata]|uniref:Uncharacterized protein n=1 Tax=Cerrena zonata TaxID=2478898 RepID=A0AAW0FQU7_9APHY
MPVLDGSTWCYTFFPKTHAVHRLPNELKSQIVHFCDMPTLVGLLHDTDWQGSVEIELTLSLLKVLAKITDRPSSFREMMRLTQSIITGSTALHYIL